MRLGRSLINYPVVKYPYTAEELAEIAEETRQLKEANERALKEMYTKDRPDALKLREHLLAAAGTDMEINEEIPYQQLLEYGEFYSETYKTIPGDPHDIPLNCMRLYDEHPDEYRIFTGLSLGCDIWWDHWWLLDEDDNVIETHMPRSLYFGVEFEE